MGGSFHWCPETEGAYGLSDQVSQMGRGKEGRGGAKRKGEGQRGKGRAVGVLTPHLSLSL